MGLGLDPRLRPPARGPWGDNYAGAGLLVTVLDEDVQGHELVELRGREREQHGAAALRPAHGLRARPVLQDLRVPEEVAAAEGAPRHGARDPPLVHDVEGEGRLGRAGAGEHAAAGERVFKWQVGK